MTFSKMQSVTNAQSNIINFEIIRLPRIYDNDEKKTESNSSDEDQIEKETNQNRKEIYGKGNEAKIIKEKLGDFDVCKSNAYKNVISHFGRSVRLSELLAVLGSIDILLQIKRNISLPKITRDEKRSFPLLIKYIERNSELVLPHLPYISLCDSHFRKISLDIK